MNITSHPDDVFWLDANPGLGRTRWVLRRKVALVHAVRSGQISLEQACQRFALSEEEFATWKRAVANGKKTKACKCFAPDQACSSCAKFFPVQSKLARTALKWTLEQAADVTGVSIRSLTRFEGDEFLSVDLLQKLRTAYEAHGIRFWKKGREVGLSLMTNFELAGK